MLVLDPVLCEGGYGAPAHRRRHLLADLERAAQSLGGRCLHPRMLELLDYTPTFWTLADAALVVDVRTSSSNSRLSKQAAIAMFFTRQISSKVPTLSLGAVSLTNRSTSQLSSGQGGQRACAHLGFSSLLRYSRRSTSSSSRGATSLENVSTMEHPDRPAPARARRRAFQRPRVGCARSESLLALGACLAVCGNCLQAALQVWRAGALAGS